MVWLSTGYKDVSRYRQLWHHAPCSTDAAEQSVVCHDHDEEIGSVQHMSVAHRDTFYALRFTTSRIQNGIELYFLAQSTVALG